MRTLAWIAVLITAATFCLPSASAGVFGPVVPYQSFNDSPFQGLPFVYFHLETFEEGALTAPGVTASGGTVVGPAPEVDSVEFGANGHSFYLPGTGPLTITFTFDAGVLGKLPTDAGIVWTDAGGPVRTFQAFDQNSQLIGTINDSTGLFFPTGDGVSSNYRFYGATNPGGISSISISDLNSGNAGLEVDDLQFGLEAPEPTELLPLGILLVGIVLAKTWRRLDFDKQNPPLCRR